MNNILIFDTLLDCQNALKDINTELGYPETNYHKGKLNATKQKTITWDNPRKLNGDVSKYFIVKPGINLTVVKQGYQDVLYKNSDHRNYDSYLEKI